MITKEAITQIHIATDKCSTKYRVLFFASLLVFFGSLFLQVFVTNDVAVKGKEIVRLAAFETSLQKDISLLELKSSELSSLDTIRVRAIEIGFLPNTTYAKLINESISTATLTSF